MTSNQTPHRERRPAARRAAAFEDILPLLMRPHAHKRSTALRGAPLKTLLAIMLVVVVPAAITLERILESALVFTPTHHASPRGYTISLIIFVLPVVVLLNWFWRFHAVADFRRVAFRQTAMFLVPTGFFLDIVLGNFLLRFPNKGATIDFNLWGFDFSDWRFHRTLPIEEFAFYVLGFLAMLLVYIWCDEVWLSRYNDKAYDDNRLHPKYLIQVHLGRIWPALVAFAMAFIWKKYGPHTHHEGWPMYFMFLLGAALVPALVFYPAVRAFVNWQALSLTTAWLLLTSLLWEVTLAMPFGWWAYNHKYMMGLHVSAWHNLPVEAVFVWLVVTFAATFLYETLKLRQHLVGVPTFGPLTFGRDLAPLDDPRTGSADVSGRSAE